MIYTHTSKKIAPANLSSLKYIKIFDTNAFRRLSFARTYLQGKNVHFPKIKFHKLNVLIFFLRRLNFASEFSNHVFKIWVYFAGTRYFFLIRLWHAVAVENSDNLKKKLAPKQLPTCQRLKPVITIWTLVIIVRSTAAYGSSVTVM